jgi:hypothetical protein
VHLLSLEAEEGCTAIVSVVGEGEGRSEAVVDMVAAGGVGISNAVVLFDVVSMMSSEVGARAERWCQGCETSS